ncbi:thioredoxin family protein, partial [Pseudomonas aeruginosa]|nr:thioredoxin family protein [Pseudomonas aeruginosa]
DAEFILRGRVGARPPAVRDGGPQALAASTAGDDLEHAIGDVLAIIEGAAR